MTDKIQGFEAPEPLEMTPDEINAIAGGPQVLNDGPASLTPDEVAAVAGGPEVLNDGPPN